MKLLYNALIVNEGKCFKGYVGIKDSQIASIGEGNPEDKVLAEYEEQEDLQEAYLLPGVIDDHVHFREPGLTQKADIESESKAAVAGGVTSYMDMPNTKPPTTTIEELEWKNRKASEVSYANYGFYIGATNDNLEELAKADYSLTPGIKLFLGSSTGNMLVDNQTTLKRIFSMPAIIAVHSEDEAIIRRNAEIMRNKYGEHIPMKCHAEIRSEEACYVATKRAVEMAKENGTRLHVLHLSTARELELFANEPLKKKKITSEVCVNHLWFTDDDYEKYGATIKCNPAIKSKADRDALRKAILDGVIDVIGSDHAPHLLTDKEGDCLQASSGVPMIQYSLVAMLEMSKCGILPITKVVEMMSHHPAELFGIEQRGYIRKGYYADLVIVKSENPNSSECLSKCGWSPFSNIKFSHRVISTYVNGKKVFNNGKIVSPPNGARLRYNRNVNTEKR